MPNYEELTGKDKELATKWMNDLVDAATAEKEAKATQELLKGKLAKLMGGPFDAVDINGGKVTGNLITPMTTSKDAVTAITADPNQPLPAEVIEALQSTTISISEESVDALALSGSEKVRAWYGVVKSKIAAWKQKQIDAAKAKDDGSHVKIGVTARKSAPKSKP